MLAVFMFAILMFLNYELHGLTAALVECAFFFL